MDELERCQKEIDLASAPVFARLEQYRKVTHHIREFLIKYFFDTDRASKLTEAGQHSEEVFNFYSIKKAMRACLADDNKLQACAQQRINQAGHPSLITALDSHISDSGLALRWRAELFKYVFEPPKPYTPKAQSFMQQFASALSIYRVSLGLYELYDALLSSKGLQTGTLKTYMDKAENLKQQLDGPVDLNALYRQVSKIKKEILALLRTENIYAGIHEFAADSQLYSEGLNTLLNCGKTQIQNAYTEFPNDAILWMYHDRSWHTLLKTLSGILYDNMYTYSTRYGTLEIKDAFMETIQSELHHFAHVASAQMPLLKIGLLKMAANHVAETKVNTLAKMAEKGITLLEAPKVSIFQGNAHPRSFYEFMVSLQHKARNGVPAEESVLHPADQEGAYLRSNNP